MTPSVRLLLGLLLGFALVRLGTLAPLELAPDEAYYHAWSRHPTTLSWLDHPPLVAWLLAPTPTASAYPEWLRPYASVGVRLPAALCSAWTAFCIALLAQPHLPQTPSALGHRAPTDLKGRGSPSTDTASQEDAPPPHDRATPANPPPPQHGATRLLDAMPIVWCAMALALTPGLGLGGLLATPDAPLLACWATASVALCRGWPWLLTGALALGLWAKLPMVLFIPAAWMGVLMGGVPRNQRRRWRVALMGGALAALPLYAMAWSQGHLVAFHLARHGGDLELSWTRPAGLLLGLLGLLTPVLGGAALGALGRGPIRCDPDDGMGEADGGRLRQRVMLWWLAALPLAIVWLGAWWVRVELNWWAIGMVALVPLVVVHHPPGPGWRPGWVWGSALVLGVMVWCGVALAAWWPDGHGPRPVLARVEGWRGWCEQLKATVAVNQRRGKAVLWATSRYQEAAELAFWTGQPATTTRALMKHLGQAAPQVVDPGRRPSAFEAMPLDPDALGVVVLVLDTAPGVALRSLGHYHEQARFRFEAPPAWGREQSLVVVILERDQER